MGKEGKILQVLEDSVCLKADQLLGYLNGSLYPEELRVVEFHLASCKICREAVEGFEKLSNRKEIINSLRLPELPNPTGKLVIKPSGSESSNHQNVQGSLNQFNTGPGIPKSTFRQDNSDLISPQRNFSWVGLVGIVVLLILGGFLFWQYQKRDDSWLPPSWTTKENKAPVAVIDSNWFSKDSADAEGINKKQKSDSNLTTGVKNGTTDKEITSDPAQNTLPKQESGSTHLDVPIMNSSSTTKQTDMRQDTPTNSTAIKNNKKKVPDKSGIDKRDSPKEIVTQEKHPPSADQTVNDHKKGEKVSSQAPSDFSTGLALYNKKQYASAILYLETAAKDKYNSNYWSAIYYSALSNLEIGKKGRAKRMLQRVEKAKVPISIKAEEKLRDL